jgi:hypothetical protein
MRIRSEYAAFLPILPLKTSSPHPPEYILEGGREETKKGILKARRDKKS